MGQILSFERERRRLRYKGAAVKVGNRHGQVCRQQVGEMPAMGCLGRNFETLGDVAARVLLRFPR